MTLPTSSAAQILSVSDGKTRNDRESDLETGSLLEYQEVVRDIASLPQVASSLDDAISSASVVELRRLLLEITRNNEAARRVANEWLLIPMGDASTPHKIALEHDNYNNEATKASMHLAPVKGDSTLKRKALEICKNCKAEYRATENIIGDCVFHPGQKEKDYESDAFVDCWNSDEEPDSDDPEFQHGFPWNCCDQPGDAKGCIVTRHEPQPIKRSRLNTRGSP